MGRADEAALTADIVELATQYGRYGYRRITALLHTAGWAVNVKRIERIWRREGLKVPRRQPKKGRLWLGRRIDAWAGQGARHRWTSEIVGRVFHAPSPWLLDDDELSLFGADQNATPAALRLALLWDELLAKP